MENKRHHHEKRSESVWTMDEDVPAYLDTNGDAAVNGKHVELLVFNEEILSLNIGTVSTS